MRQRTVKRPRHEQGTPSGTALSETSLVLDAVRSIVQALRSAQRRSETQSGVSGAQLFVLQRLSERPAASLGELAARTFTHQSSVSVVVKRLVARGLVTRAQAPDDNRRIELSLTPAGRAVLRRSPQAVQFRMIEALERFSAADRRTLARLLTRLVEAMGAGKAAPSMFFEEGSSD